MNFFEGRDLGNFKSEKRNILMKTKEVGVIFGISVKVTLAILLAIIALSVIVLHVFIPKIRGELSFATAVVGGTAVVYAGYYAGISVKLTLEQSRMEHSFEILSCLNTLDMARIRLLIESESSQRSISPEALYKKINEDKDLLSAVTTILGLWEDTSIGIRLGYLSEDILFYSLSFIIPMHFDGLRHFIDEERKRYNDAYLFCELEKLADTWKNKRSLLTGEVYEFTT